MDEWTIQQGDQYYLPLYITTRDGKEITSGNCAGMRFGIGGFTAYWPDGTLVYAGGVWLARLTEGMSRALLGRDVPLQAQATFSDGSIWSSAVQTVTVARSLLSTDWGRVLTDADGESASGTDPPGSSAALVIALGTPTLPSQEYYTGSYEAVPSFSRQVLDTSDKILTEDVVVTAIPVYKTVNLSGGNTVVIGN